MKRILILALAITVLYPAFATADIFTLKGGYYLPKAGGGMDSLWQIEFDQMTFKKSDMNAGILGVGYEYFLSKQLSLELSVETYSKTKAGIYRDYVGYAFDEGDFAFPFEFYDGDFDIQHRMKVRITPLQLSLKLLPMGRQGRIIPYVGGGVGLYFWNVGIRGEIVDFADDTWVYDDPDLGAVQIYPINLSDTFEGGRVSVGYHAMGGLMVPIGNRVTISAEFRANFAKGKWKSDSAFFDFEDFDLGGYALTAGFNYWF